jgi:hypothetical protein
MSAKQTIFRLFFLLDLRMLYFSKSSLANRTMLAGNQFREALFSAGLLFLEMKTCGYVLNIVNISSHPTGPTGLFCP